MTSKSKILCQLANGSFGNIFLCDHGGQKVVCKRIPFKLGQSFDTELSILLKCNHPRIIKLLSFFTTQNHFNIILEYATHGSLRNLIDRFQREHYKLCYEDLISIFSDMAFGLKYLHQRSIIHRDLKPENVLLVENHRAKIADFGISKFITSSQPINHTIVGTICYMSPEVFLHQPYDSSSDIWGLGLIFYELAMMKYAFTTEQKARILNYKLSFIPPQIDYVRRKYDPKVQEILEMMVQRDPKKRSSIARICNHTIVRSSPDYAKLVEEDYQLC